MQACASKLFCTAGPEHCSQKAVKSGFDQESEYLLARPYHASSLIHSFTANQTLQENWKPTVTSNSNSNRAGSVGIFSTRSYKRFTQTQRRRAIIL